MSETTVLPRAHRQAPGQDSAEQIRRHEVSRALKKMELSPEEEEAVEQLSYSLVAKLLLGPISEVVVACAGMRASHGGRGIDRTRSTGEASPEG